MARASLDVPRPLVEEFRQARAFFSLSLWEEGQGEDT
jgi:hypothetical protein